MNALNAAAVEAGVREFFADRGGASLRLPTGWFGRPYDNWHTLSGTESVDDTLRITLEDRQQLTVKCAGPAVREGTMLAIPVHGGEWAWTEYGGSRRREQSFGAGRIEFHSR